MLPEGLPAKPLVKVIYLFAGKRRHSDVGSFLRKLEAEGRIELQLHEFDIERSDDHDLRRQDLWDNIHELLGQGGSLLSVLHATRFPERGFNGESILVLGHCAIVLGQRAFHGCPERMPRLSLKQMNLFYNV